MLSPHYFLSSTSSLQWHKEGGLQSAHHRVSLPLLSVGPSQSPPCELQLFTSCSNTGPFPQGHSLLWHPPALQRLPPGLLCACL